MFERVRPSARRRPPTHVCERFSPSDLAPNVRIFMRSGAKSDGEKRLAVFLRDKLFGSHKTARHLLFAYFAPGVRSPCAVRPTERLQKT